MVASQTNINNSDFKINLSWLKTSCLEVDLGYDYDFFKAFAYIKSKYDTCYLFESLALPRHQDRYYALGFDPALIMSARADKLKVSGARAYMNLCFPDGPSSKNTSAAFKDEVDNSNLHSHQETARAKESNSDNPHGEAITDNQHLSAGNMGSISLQPDDNLTSSQLLNQSNNTNKANDSSNSTITNSSVTSTDKNASTSTATNSEDLKTLNFKLTNPYKSLQSAVNFNFFSKNHQGGLIGYFCYEAVNYFEESINLAEHEDFPPFKLGLFTDGLIYDSVTASISYYTFAEDRSELVKELLENSRDFTIPNELENIDFKGHSETKAEFIEATKRTINKIKEGYSFQAEVGFKSNYEIQGDKLAIYNKLREINPGPYMYFMKFADEELCGASPEILITCNQGKILTTPTAGTIKRGASEREDMLLARTLLNDPKEIAEHNMLVDLHRNDVAIVSEPGTVKVSDLMYIIKFSHVQHIVSNVVGELSADADAFDVLAAILPGGVVAGAPKIETLKIIAENENSARGCYGGAIGRFSFSGNCDFCLPIRSIFCKGDKCYVQTSAGIVYDSVPEKEYDEVLRKLAAMQQTLSALGAKNHECRA
jgi:anthranilate synthase component 1